MRKRYIQYIETFFDISFTSCISIFLFDSIEDSSDDLSSALATNGESTTSSSHGLGTALREAVWQAQEQGRLSCGMNDCIEQLNVSVGKSPV